MKKLALLIPVLILAGCSTASSRMADCQDKGYSRDTCYQAEQNRENTNRAAILGASEAQAYKNANSAYSNDEHRHHHHHADQYAQSGHRNLHGCTQVQDANGTCHTHAAVAEPAPYVAKHMTPIHVNKFGVDFKRSPDGFAYINGSAAALDEDGVSAQVYQGGTYNVIVYKKNGRIDVMNHGTFVGRMR